MRFRIIRFRLSGVLFIILSIVLGVIAIFNGNNLLFLVTSLLLGCMLGSGVIGRINIRGVRVTLSYAEESYAGLPSSVFVTVSNRSGKRPIFLIEVCVEGQKAVFPCIQPGESVQKALLVTFPSRGEHRLSAFEVSSIYPFYFFRRYGSINTPSPVLVFPAPCYADIYVPVFHDGTDKRDAPEILSDMDEDIVGVRAYEEGDSMKRVDWKSSARTGTLKTRLYEGEDAGEGDIIDMDSLLLRENTEKALSMACYLIVQSMKTGSPIGIKYQHKVFPPGQSRRYKRKLLALLARYGMKEGEGK